MALQNLILDVIALIILFLGIIFVYYDIKTRSISNRLFSVMLIFSIIEFIMFILFQFSIILVVPIIIIILTSIVSYYTGNIGIGDLPFLASILIFIFAIGNTMTYLIVFMISFMLSFLLIPFVLYRKILTNNEKILAYLSVFITAMVFIINIIAGMFIFLIVISLLSYILLIKKDKIYESAVKYITKDNLVIGDLIENRLLTDKIRLKLKIDRKDGLTNIDNKLISKIDDKMELPIYSNSIPFTIPILVGFVCVVLMFLVFL